jgi:hypothetical protein
MSASMEERKAVCKQERGRKLNASKGEEEG